MTTVQTSDQPPATPEEIWAILRETARYQRETAHQQQENERRWKEGIARREAEEAKRKAEEAEREAKRKAEEAERKAEEAEREAKRKAEEAEREAKRKAEEAERKAEEARRKAEEAEREAKRKAEEAERKAEEAERRKEEAERKKEEAERQKKADQEWEKLREMFSKTDSRIKENNEKVGGLGRSYGKLVEHLVGPGVVKRFGEQGYRFDGIKKQRYKLFDDVGNTETDIDLLLENADTVIAVEVKSRPDGKGKYLGQHLMRLEIMRAHSKAEGWEGKRILGAIAGAIFETPEKNATLKAGLFVIEQSGETMKMEVPAGFVPREW